VVTLALSLGVRHMAKENALVRRLSAVESLGSVTVIATDKTGTLTRDRLAVEEIVAPNVEAALRAMAIANAADPDTGAGHPLDVALLEHARAEGIDAATERARPRLGARPFDSAWRYMRVTVAVDERPTSFVKGAPEAVLPLCDLSDASRSDWAARAEEAA